MKFYVFNKKLILVIFSLAIGLNNSSCMANSYAVAPGSQSEFKRDHRVEYHIKSEEDYRRVITARNRLGYSGVVIYLESDINFKIPVIPIGSENTPFEGKFYGGGHTLSNVFFNWEELTRFGIKEGGIFNRVRATEDKVEILDLKIKGAPEEEIAFISFVDYGLLEGEKCVEIRNCEIEESSVMKETTRVRAKGLISYVSMGRFGNDKLIIKDCVFGGKATEVSSKTESKRMVAGAFIGVLDLHFWCGNNPRVEIIGCSNKGEINGCEGKNLIRQVCTVGAMEEIGIDKYIDVYDCDGITNEIGEIKPFFVCVKTNK